MPSATSPAERRLWIAAGLYLAAIYASLYFLPLLLAALRERNLLRLSLAVAVARLAAGVVVWAIRERAGWREWATLVGVGAPYAFILSRMEILQERLHVPEYGVLGLLCAAALRRRFASPGAAARPPRPKWLVPLVAIALSGAAGWIDEGIQGLLPNRVYDLRDVAFNTAGAAGAIAALGLRDLARARDPRAKSSRRRDRRQAT